MKREAVQPRAEGRAGKYAGPTYYDVPVIKSSHYNWLVWSYIYVAGLSGGAQIIATLANRLRRPGLHGVVRNGRWLGTMGSAIGAVLLVADLHTPRRWYNMLRIIRTTSPMSIGSYILTSFGLSSALTTLSHLWGKNRPGWARHVEGGAEIPAAIAGAGMTCYTGALLSSTSTPMWASSPRVLSARFACSSIASAASALSVAEHLWGDTRNTRSLDRIALLAAAAEAGLSSLSNRQYREAGVASSLTEGRHATPYKLATVLAHVVPLACHGINSISARPSRRLSLGAAFGILAGGLLMRATIMNAGNESAKAPRDYFSLTQGEQQPRRLPDAVSKIGNRHGRTDHKGIARGLEGGTRRS